MPKKHPTTKAGKKAKVGKVMHEFKEGTLHSSSGQAVTSKKQAIAIAMSEAGIEKGHKKAVKKQSMNQGANKAKKG